MEIRNCKKCGKPFAVINAPICKDCEKEEEAIFEQVRDYVKATPGASIAEVSEVTGASAKKIMKYVKDGKIDISSGMHGEITCDKCGRPIASGKYCNNCVLKINRKIDQTFGKERPDDEADKKTGPRMHISKKNL